MRPLPKTIGSLFSGIGGLELGLERATGARTIWNCEIEPFCRRVLAKHWPDAKQYNDVKEIDAEVEAPDLICGGFPCFVAGTMITTAEGIIPIENVKIGDLVLTHEQRWRRVVKTMRKSGARVWSVRAFGAPPVQTTAEHPFYARKRERRWNKVRRRYEYVYGTPEWVEVSHLTEEHFLAQPWDTRRSRVPSWVTGPLAYVIGRWLGDGMNAWNRQAFREGGFAWVPVREVVSTKQLAVVFNLEVEEDHSYVADSFVVHNCQDLSVAGTREGLEGEKSGLWREYARVVRVLHPAYVFVENVPALRHFVSDGGLGRVLGDLVQSGYDTEWDCVPAVAVGAPHVRDRIFIFGWRRAVADADEARRAERRGAFSATSAQGAPERSGRDASGGFDFPPPPASPRWIEWLKRHPGAQPGLRRSDEGFSAEMVRDRRRRLRALGNAVVPQAAERAWELLFRRSQELL